MTNATGRIRYARTNGLGYFRLEDIPAGTSYLLEVSDKRYEFETRVINVQDDILDLMLLPATEP
jgi:hypothetical protein